MLLGILVLSKKYQSSYFINPGHIQRRHEKIGKNKINKSGSKTKPRTNKDKDEHQHHSYSHLTVMIHIEQLGLSGLIMGARHMIVIKQFGLMLQVVVVDSMAHMLCYVVGCVLLIPMVY